jgi:chromosome segregation ATPase
MTGNSKINIVEGFEDICNDDDDTETLIEENNDNKIENIKDYLINIESKLEGLNNIYNNLKNVDDDVLNMIQNELHKYEKKHDEYLMKFGKVEIELMEWERKLNELNLQIQNQKIQISQKTSEKNKVLCDYKSNENKYKKIKYINQRYGKNHILETIKNYADFYNLNIKNVTLEEILDSSAGFEGWFDSRNYF